MNVNDNGQIVINYDTFSIIVCIFSMLNFLVKQLWKSIKNNINDKNT